jgi:hypothetical protein
MALQERTTARRLHRRRMKPAAMRTLNPRCEMNARLRVAAVMACAALAAAACDAGGAFTGAFGTNGGTGSIQGQVTANGTGLGGVTVVLVNRDSTVTTAAGVFTFPSVAAGTYQIAARVPFGFTLAAGETSPRSVTVTNGANTGVTFILQSTTIP